MTKNKRMRNIYSKQTINVFIKIDNTKTNICRSIEQMKEIVKTSLNFKLII